LLQAVQKLYSKSVRVVIGAFKNDLVKNGDMASSIERIKSSMLKKIKVTKRAHIDKIFVALQYGCKNVKRIQKRKK